MWSNNKRISDVVRSLERKAPPYCPRATCIFHNGFKPGAYIHYGGRSIQRFPYKVYRYQCKACDKHFSSSFFELSYWDKTNDCYEEIFELHRKGATKLGIAEFLGITESSVRAKMRKLARQTLLIMAQDTQNLVIKEPLAFDGIENFSFSQFDPNNINHAVGKESFFVYDFNFSPLNRKGRMSERQKIKKKKLEEVFGSYPRNAIESSTKRVFERLLLKTERNLHLHTDNHCAYRRALAKIPGNKRIAHFITPAKIARNYRNRLFAINHLDLLTRQETAPFKRETISFSKHPIAMIESFILYAGYKNYMRAIFLKKHKREPSLNKETPAQRLKIRHKKLSFREMFKTRITKAQVKLNEDWERFFYRLEPTSRRPILAYSGI